MKQKEARDQNVADLSKVRLPHVPPAWRKPRLFGLAAKVLGMALSCQGAARAENPSAPPPPSRPAPTGSYLSGKGDFSLDWSKIEDFKLPDRRAALGGGEKLSLRETAKQESTLERLLKPDEISFSFSLQKPKLATPGKAFNYIERYYGQENPFRFLGDNAVVAPNIDLRYFLNPKEEHPSLIFLNLASASVDCEGTVKFLTVPFNYRMHNETERLGLGYQIYAFKKDSPSNLAFDIRADLYGGSLSVKGRSPFWIERFHDEGLGGGAAVGISFDQKISGDRNNWLFFRAEYTKGVIADYARLDGFSFFVGIRIDLCR